MSENCNGDCYLFKRRMQPGNDDILHRLHRAPSGSPLIVTSPSADEALWAEVLNLGGFDVLAQPFDVMEVSRVTDAATRYTSRSVTPLQAAAHR